MPSWLNAPTGTASIQVSTPPQIAMSASPRMISRHACAMAAAPEASAMIGLMMPALALRSSPTAAAGALGMYFWIAVGGTARSPLAFHRSYCKMSSSVVPSAMPMDTMSRRVSTSGLPAVSHNRRPSTVDIWPMYESRCCSTRPSLSANASVSCPPMRTGESNSSTNGLSRPGCHFGLPAAASTCPRREARARSSTRRR